MSTSELYRATFKGLPFDIVDRICELLSQYHRPSLFGISLVNGACCRVANKWRFERVQLQLSGKAKLSRDLQRWNEIFGRNDCYGNTRALKVVGCLPLCGCTDDYAYGQDKTVENGHSGDQNRFYEPSDDLVQITVKEAARTIEQKQRQDTLWLPVTRFIRQLTGLQDFIYACEEQVPRLIVSTLQENRAIRLHIHSFSLRSLYQDAQQLHDIDDDEYAIVTSPNLHSIAVRYCDSDYFDDGPRAGYNQDAVLQMVAYHSPGLRNVWMYTVEGGALITRPPWRGFYAKHAQEAARTTRGCLHHLVLDSGYSRIQPNIVAWSQRTRFSLLRSLKILTPLTLQTLQTMARVASGEGFGCLTLLQLNIEFYKSAEAQVDEGSLLLKALPPLQHLHLRGHLSHEILSVILHRHGAALESLTYCPSFDSCVVNRHAEDIVRLCPRLETLTVCIRREEGKGLEFALYHTLGALRRVVHIELELDCHIQGSKEHKGGETPTAKAYALHLSDDEIRTALLNAAIDSAMARSIFSILSSTNIAARESRQPSLQSLTIIPVGVNFVSDDFQNEMANRGMYTVLEWIGRSWTCKKDLRDNHVDEVAVYEISKDNRMIEGYFDESLAEDEDCAKAWYQLWPAVPGQLSAKESCHSVSLEA